MPPLQQIPPAAIDKLLTGSREDSNEFNEAKSICIFLLIRMTIRQVKMLPLRKSYGNTRSPTEKYWPIIGL